MPSHKERLPLTALRISDENYTKTWIRVGLSYKERWQYSCNYNERVKALEAFDLKDKQSPTKQFAGLRIKARAPGEDWFAVYSVRLIDVTAAEFVAVVPGPWIPAGQVAEQASNLRLFLKQ